jgi:hypothetical protein
MRFNGTAFISIKSKEFNKEKKQTNCFLPLVHCTTYCTVKHCRTAFVQLSNTAHHTIMCEIEEE